MTKTTLRLPGYVVEKLRERSHEERRSMNDVATEALLRGLGEEITDPVMIFGSLLYRPALERYDPEEHEAWRKKHGLKTGSFDEDLDWIRGD